MNQRISEARDLGRKYGGDVIVLVRSEHGQWSGSSWGRTKARCSEMAKVLDRIFDEILDPMVSGEGADLC